MNKGIKKSTGDIIGILNADDFYYSDALLTVKKYFEDFSNIDRSLQRSMLNDSRTRLSSPRSNQDLGLVFKISFFSLRKIQKTETKH